MNKFLKLLTVITTIGFGACSNATAFEDDPDNSIAAEHLQLADQNSDGALNKEEFKEFVALEAEDDIGMSRRLKRFGAYDRAFNVLDADGSGGVTLGEIATARKQRNQ